MRVRVVPLPRIYLPFRIYLYTVIRTVCIRCARHMQCAHSRTQREKNRPSLPPTLPPIQRRRCICVPGLSKREINYTRTSTVENVLLFSPLLSYCRTRATRVVRQNICGFVRPPPTPPPLDADAIGKGLIVQYIATLCAAVPVGGIFYLAEYTLRPDVEERQR